MDPFFNFFHSYRQSAHNHKLNGFPNFDPKNIYQAKNIPLISKSLPEINLEQVLLTRVSTQKPANPEINFSLLSNLLRFSAGLNNSNQHRTHPSGGAKYPVITYLLIFQVIDLPAGLYYYNPITNSISELKLFSSKEIQTIKSHLSPDYQNLKFFINFSFLRNRSFPKYGSLSYEAALIEAGHIAQNFSLTATALNLNFTPTLTFDSNYFNQLFNLETSNENIFYSLVF